MLTDKQNKAEEVRLRLSIAGISDATRLGSVRGLREGSGGGASKSNKYSV
eukprot:SAG25_NODE_5222_length_686_cov_0.914821_2_plen_49_part_01